MKSKADLVRGWLRKAESDLTSAGLSIAAGQALDGACFHAQQAAEKCLKAYLSAYEIEFPFVHNLEKLIDLCVQRDGDFASIKTLGQNLTPFAVELRYDAEFWPTLQTAQQALDAGTAIRDFVLVRLAAALAPPTP
jgi:HEPN domain-containing protein